MMPSVVTTPRKRIVSANQGMTFLNLDRDDCWSLIIASRMKRLGGKSVNSTFVYESKVKYRNNGLTFISVIANAIDPFRKGFEMLCRKDRGLMFRIMTRE